MRQVPLERDINIAVNGCSGFSTSTQKESFTAMLISRSRGTPHSNTPQEPNFIQALSLFSFVAGLKPELEVRDGSFLELRVQVRGDPDPQVTWTKDGRPLSSSDVLEVKPAQ